jgi:hypothetical protein
MDYGTNGSFATSTNAKSETKDFPAKKICIAPPKPAFKFRWPRDMLRPPQRGAEQKAAQR